jgi:hypothetical protein
MSKIDFSVLENYSEADAVEFDKEIGAFLDGTLTETAPSKEAVAFFYFTLHKRETEDTGTHEEMQPFYARLRYDDIRSLEGKMLTILDASIGEPRQNKAIKDIVRRAIWFDWSNTLDKTCPQMDSGMPQLESYGVIN